MEKKFMIQFNVMKIVIIVLVSFNMILLFSSFEKNQNKIEKFKEIDVERINIIEEDGTLKLALFNSARLQKGIAKRQGEGEISGLMFYNEEGYECGGLVYGGKKIAGGQKQGVGLMFDGYRQDQTLALQHNEYKDSANAEYDDGLTINYRPDRSLVKEEYTFYDLLKTFKGTDEQKDSLKMKFADEGKVSNRRLFIGHRRGNKTATGSYEETGLFIKNRYGRPAFNIYVDKFNKPHFEVFDSLGKKVNYEINFNAIKK